MRLAAVEAERYFEWMPVFLKNKKRGIHLLFCPAAWWSKLNGIMANDHHAALLLFPAPYLKRSA
jgi:hypothetical protein